MKEIQVLLEDIDQQSLELDYNISKLFNETNDPLAPIVNTKNSSNEIVVTREFINSAISLLSISEKVDDNYLNLDGYINTAVYCFRNYLEIILKDTLSNYGIDKSKWGKGANAHNLSNLWNLLKQHIKPVDNRVDSVEKVINEISDADQHSTSFRYPYSLNKLFSNKNTDSIYAKVNIKEMKKTMLQLYRFFEDINEESIDF